MNGPVRNKTELLARLRENEQRLSELGVCGLGLFGSFARDEARSESDVDVLIQFDAGKKTFKNFMELSFFLEELLQRRVEIVTAESLSPHIGPKILESVEYVTEAA